MKLRFTGCIVLMVLLAVPAAAHNSASEQVARVAARLLAVITPPPDYHWPPAIEIQPQSDPNAFAQPRFEKGHLVVDAAGRPCFRVVLSTGLLDRVIQGHDDRLALVMGHEMSHILLRHLESHRSHEATLMRQITFTREQEFAADRNGMALALKAGYSFPAAIAAFKEFIRQGIADYSAIEGLTANHPSWKDRMAALDAHQASLWRSLSAFENGAILLSLEQFPAAQRCFESVVRQFPRCYEAWTDLGYSRLMQLCDAFSAADLQRLNVAQPACGGFYARPASLEAQVRGSLQDLWEGAVTALKRSLALHGGQPLAEADLGMAYLVRPLGSQPATARRYLSAAAAEARGRTALDPLDRGVILVNAGVAELANGNSAACMRELVTAVKIAGEAQGSVALLSPILYAQSMALASSSSPDGARAAVSRLKQYLAVTPTASPWWQVAFHRYQGLCRQLHQAPEEPKSLHGAVHEPLRPVLSVELGDGLGVALSDPMAEVEKRLGQAVTIPVVAGTDMVRLHYPRYGMDVIGTDRVMAISLKGEKAPALPVQPVGIGDRPERLRIGMPAASALKILEAGGSKSRREVALDPAVAYRFYPTLGLAVRIQRGRVAELLVALIPRASKKSGEQGRKDTSGGK